MSYVLESDGSVRLQERVVPVPRTISVEAQAMLRMAATMPVSVEPMWAERRRVDAVMAALNDAALERYPAEVKETEIGGCGATSCGRRTCLRRPSTTC